MFPPISFLPRNYFHTITFGQNRLFQKIWNSNRESSIPYKTVFPSFISTWGCWRKSSQQIMTPESVRSPFQITAENKNFPHSIKNTDRHHHNNASACCCFVSLVAPTGEKVYISCSCVSYFLTDDPPRSLNFTKPIFSENCVIMMGSMWHYCSSLVIFIIALSRFRQMFPM